MISSDVLLASEPLRWIGGTWGDWGDMDWGDIRADSTWRGRRAPWVPSHGFPPGYPGGLPEAVEAPRVVMPRVVLPTAVPRVVLPPQRPVARQMPKPLQPNRPPTAKEVEEARLRTPEGVQKGVAVEPTEERPAEESEEAERAAREALYALLSGPSDKEAPSAARSGHQGGQEEGTKEAGSGSGGTKRCSELEDGLAKEIADIFTCSEADEAAFDERARRRAEEAEITQEERRKARKIKREEAWELQLAKEVEVPQEAGVLEVTATEVEDPQGEEVLEATSVKVEVAQGEEVLGATSMEVGEEESQEAVKMELCEMIREVNTMCERFDGSSSSSSSGVRISYTIHVCYLVI